MENRGSVENGGMDRMDRVSGVDRVVRSGMRGGFVRSVFGFSRVLHISDVSTISVIHTVSDSLDATIGQSNVVFTGSSVSIAVLRLTELGSTVVIGDSVVVVVDGGGKFLGVDGGGADS